MPLSAVSLLTRALADAGFTFVHAPAMRALLEEHAPLEDWASFARTWDALEWDEYLASTGRARRRRHAVFMASRDGVIERAPHQPHYQAVDYNPLQGGIERWFAPISDEAGASASLRCILGFSRQLFNELSPPTKAWKIEVHQFRIEAAAGRQGEPTPEGRHRDGVEFVLVLLVRRTNIASGVTSIYDARTQEEIGSFTLTTPFDAALVDDHRVFHGVTAVEPLEPARPACRDVLVVTFRAAP